MVVRTSDGVKWEDMFVEALNMAGSALRESPEGIAVSVAIDRERRGARH